MNLARSSAESLSACSIAQSSPAYFCCIAVARIPPVLSS